MVSRCRNTNEFLEANPGAGRLQQSRVMLAALISGVAEALIILHNLEIIHGTLKWICFRTGGHRMHQDGDINWRRRLFPLTGLRFTHSGVGKTALSDKEYTSLGGTGASPPRIVVVAKRKGIVFLFPWHGNINTRS